MQELSFRGLAKSYGAAPVLKDVALRLRAGRIHALMGENGAGKSTLIKLIAGVVRPDAMEVFRDGTPLALRTPAEAEAAGFRFIHQELNIVPQLTVAENILLGRPAPRRLGLFIDWPALEARAQAALDVIDARHIDLSAQAGSLSTGDKMLTRIAAALVADGAEPVLYVLDEPTAALTAGESARLFAALERLAAKGAAVLYVSHRMDEVMALCHEVSVLRDGRMVLQAEMAQTSRAALIAAMTGKAVSDAVPARASAIGASEVVRAERTDLCFSLRAGEVLGLAGLEGAGQAGVLRRLLGAERVPAGLEILGGPQPQSPAEAWARGIAYVPGERRAEGLMLGMGARPNMLLPHLRGLWARRSPEAERAAVWAAEVRLKAQSLDQPVGELSGGNQQKVVFARALAGAPRLLLLDEPTRGVDVGARAEIHALIRRASAAGTAVVLASSDLPELIGLSDRLLILARGRQAGLIDKTPDLTPAALLAEVQAASQRRVP
jgi:ribose transport system ATP-binding protein